MPFIEKIATLLIFAQFSIILSNMVNLSPSTFGILAKRYHTLKEHYISYLYQKKLEGGEWWGYVFQTYILMVSARKKSLIALLFCFFGTKTPPGGQIFSFDEKPF